MRKNPFFSKPIWLIQPLIVFCLLLRLKTANGFVAEVDFLPFNESSGATNFDFGDDDHTEIKLDKVFKFLGRSYTSVWINGNGAITFGRGSGVTSYNCNLTAPSIPTLSVFMADGKNYPNATGQLLYRQDTSRESIEKVSLDVFKGFPEIKGIQLNWMLIVTWHNIPQYGNSIRRNTFQGIMCADDTYSFVLFYYSNVTWPQTKERFAAEVGIYGAREDSRNSHLIPGSCKYSLTNRITEMSNIDEPGKFVFRVDNGLQLPTSLSNFSPNLTCPPPPSCPTLPGTKISEGDANVLATPQVITGIGNQSIFFTHPGQMDTTELSSVTCVFSGFQSTKRITTQCTVLQHQNGTSNSVITCPVPIIPTLGKVNIKLKMKYHGKLPIWIEGQFWYQKQPKDSLKQLDLSLESDENLRTLIWNPSTFQSNASCDMSLILMQQLGNFWGEMGQIDSNICNTGSYQVSNLSISDSLKNVPLVQIFGRPTVVALKGPSKSGNDTMDMISQTVALDLLSSIVLLHYLWSTSKENGELSDELSQSESFEIPDFDDLCKQWCDYEMDEEYVIPTKNLIPCPTSAVLAEIDPRFSQVSPKRMHYVSSASISALFIQTLPNSKSGFSVQCAYNQAGNLMIGSQHGSLIHRYSSNAWEDGAGFTHFTEDTLPYLHCCKWSKSKEDNCRHYFEQKRGIPFNKLQKYKVPTFSHVFGAGHFETFDGFQYSFNGAGEYWMLAHAERKKWNAVNQFKCQVRMEPYLLSPDEGEAKVSVVSAVAMEQLFNGNKVTIQVSRNVASDFDVLVDGDLLNSNELDTIYHEGVIIFFNRTAYQILLTFQNGVFFKFTATGRGEQGMNIVISAPVDKFAYKTGGLVGNMDGDASNDLGSPSGTLLPSDASYETIRQQFGQHWRVAQSDSIFSYPAGKSYQDFYKSDFGAEEPVSSEMFFKSRELLRLCKDSEECMSDFMTTGSRNFSMAGKDSQKYFEEIRQRSKLPLKECPNPKQNQAGVVDVVVIESLGVGTLVQIPYYINPTTTVNVTFECVEHDNSTYKWVSHDTNVSLTGCLYPNYPGNLGRESSSSLDGF